MTKDILTQLEQNIADSKKIIELGNAYDRLQSNRDFKKLINEAYFEQEAVRLVHLLSDPTQQSAQAQESIQKQMQAIGGLRSFFTVLQQRVNMARNALNADEATREEILGEE